MSELVLPGDDTSDYDQTVSSLIEMGTSATGPITSWSAWRKDAYQLSNKPLVPLRELIRMRRTDGQARAIARLVCLPVKLALQQGRWVAPDSGGGEEEVEFANAMWTLPPMLGGMTTPASDAISQMLLAITDGFAAFELVSHIPEVGPLKGKKTLRKMAYRAPQTVTLLQDSHGGYAGFRQNTIRQNGEKVDVSLQPEKTVLFTVQGEENPLYGISYFESAYTHYEAKLKWYYISEMAGQFAAVPGRIGTVPRHAKPNEVIAFKNALENFFFNTTILKKDGFEVEPFNPMSGFNFMQYIEHHNMMMSKSVLATFFESDQRTVLVENSTQDASADIFLLSMETLAQQFADVLTYHVMPKYINENFQNTDTYPVFKPGPLSDNARKQIMSLFQTLAQASVLNLLPETMRSLEKNVARDLGLDVDFEDVEAREAEAAEAQSQVAEAMAAQAQQDSIEEERAAEGGLPNAPLPQSGVDMSELEDITQTEAYAEALDALYLAAQDIFVDEPVDRGF